MLGNIVLTKHHQQRVWLTSLLIRAPETLNPPVAPDSLHRVSLHLGVVGIPAGEGGVRSSLPLLAAPGLIQIKNIYLIYCLIIETYLPISSSSPPGH